MGCPGEALLLVHTGAVVRPRLLPGFVALGLVVAACTVDDASTGAPATTNDAARATMVEAGSAQANPSTPTTLPVAEDPTPSETDLTGRAAFERETTLDRARALITPTGVVVPVIEEGADGYRILTPCGDEVTLVWGTPIYRAEVAIDAGHGGSESGAQGPNGLVEKDLNLLLARRAARVLTDRGISVVLTRSADYRIPLSSRAAIANELEVAVMISIHHNAPVVNPSAGPGSEVFVQSGSAESRRLGGLVYEEIVAALEQFEDVEWVTASDAGALAVLNRDDEDAYGMIRRPNMPAVLAEFGYLANRSEAELFATDEYLDVAATALADAVERWLDTDDPGSGFVDEPRRFTPDGGTGGSGGCDDPPLE
ncbi:MAG: N-acetylmuramoyl-L-alanine amidase [Acidimicrobiales bacterium]